MLETKEVAWCILDVPEPEAMAVSGPMGEEQDIFKVAVVGRGMQVVKFKAGYFFT